MEIRSRADRTVKMAKKMHDRRDVILRQFCISVYTERKCLQLQL